MHLIPWLRSLEKATEQLRKVFLCANRKIQKSRDRKIWKSENLEIQGYGIQQMKICVAQNVRKVLISRNKKLLTRLQAILDTFPWAGQIQIICFFLILFPWWSNGCYLTGLGPLLLYVCIFPVAMTPHAGRVMERTLCCNLGRMAI